MYIEDAFYNFVVTAREFVGTSCSVVGAIWMLAKGIEMFGRRRRVKVKPH